MGTFRIPGFGEADLLFANAALLLLRSWLLETAMMDTRGGIGAFKWHGIVLHTSRVADNNAPQCIMYAFHCYQRDDRPTKVPSSLAIQERKCRRKNVLSVTPTE